MPCRQTSTHAGFAGFGKPSGGGYATEAECNQACKEGACCDGTTCTVKPQCQCQGAGQTFRGVGTTCTAHLCLKCGWVSDLPSVVTVTLSDCVDNAHGTNFATMNGSYSLVLETRYVADPDGFARYVSDLDQNASRRVGVDIECNSSGFVRYRADVRTNRVYSAAGNLRGPFVDSANKCFTTSFPGGSAASLSCNFLVSCVTPLP